MRSARCFAPGPKPPNREPAVTCIQVPDSIRRHSRSSLRSAHDIRSGWVRIETYPAASKSKKGGRHSGGGNGAADRRARIDSLMARASPDLNLPTRSAATWASHPGTRRQSMPAESSSNCSDCTRRRVSGPELSYMLGLMCGSTQSRSSRRPPTCGPSSTRSADRVNRRLSPG